MEHTNFIAPEHYGGDHIIYCGDYLNPDHEYFQLSKEELLERFLPALTRFNPDFDRSWVKDTWLWKTAYAQPVPPVNHSQNIPPLRTPRARPLLRQHEPGLPVGSRHELRRGDREPGGGDGDGRLVVNVLRESRRMIRAS